MKKLILFLWLAVPLTAYCTWPSEINIGTSLDWMCYDADVIVIGKLTSTAHNPKADPLTDYQSRNTLTVSYVLKGAPGTSSITFTSRLEYIGGYPLAKMVDTEVLLFLKVQHGHFHAWNDDYSLILLQKPNGHALTGDFRSLGQKDSIVTYIESTLEKLEGKKAQPYYLEVPFDTPAHGVLYSGSSCYIIVPDILYPKARKTLFED